LGIEIVLSEPTKYFAHRKNSIGGVASFSIAKETLTTFGLECPIWLVGVQSKLALMDKSLSDLIEFCQQHNRIFPKEIYWSYLYDLLRSSDEGEIPPHPSANCPWEDHYNSLFEAESDHRMLFLQHLKYAHQTNALERCSRFLRSLDGEDRWVHTGEYTGGVGF
jgi:hypothetical protein